MTLDDETSKAFDGITEEKTAQAQAVESLITVKDRQKGKNSDIELKTDLDINQIKIHSTLDIFGKLIEDGIKDQCILSPIIEKLERKSLSKGRQSRREIVDVARNPDMMNITNESQPEKQSAWKRMFSPRR